MIKRIRCYKWKEYTKTEDVVIIITSSSTGIIQDKLEMLQEQNRNVTQVTPGRWVGQNSFLFFAVCGPEFTKDEHM